MCGTAVLTVRRGSVTIGDATWGTSIMLMLELLSLWTIRRTARRALACIGVEANRDYEDARCHDGV